MNCAMSSNDCVLTTCVLPWKNLVLLFFSNKNIEVLPLSKIDNKFLGIIIDNNLIFAKHIFNLCSNISRSIGLLKNLNIAYLGYN